MSVEIWRGGGGGEEGMLLSKKPAYEHGGGWEGLRNKFDMR